MSARSDTNTNNTSTSPSPKRAAGDALAAEQIRAVRALADWKPTGGKWASLGNKTDLDVLYELTERSLKEVKALTEHEDNKAQRILTAMAFLAAVGGAIFALAVRSLFDAHAILPYVDLALPINWLALFVYAGFGLYAVLLGIGAVTVLYAIMPRFAIPADWSKEKRRDWPASFLFAVEILKVPYDKWVTAYTQTAAENLRFEYVRNSIFETYLVAQKVAVKLRPLGYGVRFLLASIMLLVLWLPVAILAIAVPTFAR